MRSLFLLTISLLLNLAHAGPNSELSKLMEADWKRQLEFFPEAASYYGDPGYNDRWDNLHPTDVRAQLEAYRATLKSYEAIRRTRLSPADRISYDLSIKNLKNKIREIEVGAHYLRLDHQWGVQNLNEITHSLKFETKKDYEDWILRLERLAPHLDKIIALQREGIAKGILHPKVVVDRIHQQIKTVLSKKGSENVYYEAFRSFPKTIPQDLQKSLSQRALKAIETSVIPGLQNYQSFLEKEYLPAAPKGTGLWQLKGGQELYQYLAEFHTTTSLSPDEIHNIGLKEVARIREDMEKVKSQVKFKGTLQEFFHHLRTDKRFFYKSSEEILTGYRALAKVIDPLMVKIFGNLPRMPYGVVPIPKESAPHAPTAYYMGPAADGTRAGNFYVNTDKPHTRPKWEMVPLTLHEAVPGHHFQISVAQELTSLPKFRRMDGATSYIEGWGLYAEFLGEELGLYSDPYDKFGQLAYEMWRAIRLVVDTGLHHKKWSREKAIQYFVDNSPRTKHDITNEIDRYIGGPGQALAYKIGQLKILELRRKAEKALGERFNVRAFHDELLRHGALPMDVLETAMEEWTQRQK